MAHAPSLHGIPIKASPWKVESLAQLKRDGKRLRGRAPAEALANCPETDLEAHGVP